MKNIYNYRINPAQNIQTINELTINNKLTLSGATYGSLLTINQTSNVIDLIPGPSHYVLEIDALTHTPKYTNNINVDEIQTNTCRINGTIKGDMLQIGTNNELLRLPIGNTNNLLRVNNAADGVEWDNDININSLTLNLNNGNIYSENGLIKSKQTQYTLNNIYNNMQTLLYAPIFYFNTNMIAGYNYKISISARVQTQDMVELELYASNTLLESWSINYDSDVSRILLFTSPSTGIIPLSFNGRGTIASNSTVSRANCFVELFN